MSDIDIDGALDALSAELPETSEVFGESVVESVDTPSVEDNPDVESFTGFDPSTLPEDMQAVYRSMQGDYTRKTQELAEVRRNFESFSENGVDPNEALEAVSLLQRLNTDPEFAAGVAKDIQTKLEELGYSQSQVEDTPDVTNNSYDGIPPELMQELEQMRSFREEMAQQQQQQQILSELDAQENTIKTINPNYTDNDMEAIYSLAYSTDGDLLAAQEIYHGIQQNLLGNYLESKSVPHGATPAPGGPVNVPSRDFGSLDEAHAAAMEAMRNAS
jgi:hypothetical protein